jgi:hypothetical protein
MTGLPSTIANPGVYGYTDPSLANTQTSGPKPIYLIGVYTELQAGKSADTPYLVGSAADVGDLFGAQSQIGRMAVGYFAGAPVGVPVYAVGLVEPSAGVKATGKITITGTATKDSAHEVWIGGQRFVVAVYDGDLPTAIGDALVSAIILGPATGGNVAGAVTITARSKGSDGNLLQIDIDPDGAPDDGTTWTLTNAMGTLVSGNGVADATNAAVAIAALPWDLCGMFLQDSDPYLVFDAIMNDTNGRWGYLKRLDGHVVNPFTGSLSGLISWRIEQNTLPWLSSWALEGTTGNAAWGTPPWEMTGAIVAACARWRSGASIGATHGNARACEEQTLIESAEWRIKPPAESVRWDHDAELPLLYAAGYATLAYGPAGKPYLYTSRTCQTETETGTPTNQWEQMRTRFIVSDFNADCRTAVKAGFQSGGALPIDDDMLTAIKATECGVYDRYCDEKRMNPDTRDAFKASASATKSTAQQRRVDVRTYPVVTDTASVITLTDSFTVG